MHNPCRRALESMAGLVRRVEVSLTAHACVHALLHSSTAARARTHTDMHACACTSAHVYAWMPRSGTSSAFSARMRRSRLGSSTSGSDCLRLASTHTARACAPTRVPHAYTNTGMMRRHATQASCAGMPHRHHAPACHTGIMRRHATQASCAGMPHRHHAPACPLARAHTQAHMHTCTCHHSCMRACDCARAQVSHL